MMNSKVLIKLSGESLLTDISKLDNYKELRYLESHEFLANIPYFGLVSNKMLLKMALDLKRACEEKILTAVVIGGGNICRGSRDTVHINQRPNADKIGMLATIINGLVLHSALSAVGIRATVLSTRSMPAICELYTASRAKTYLESGHVVICVGGSGQPFFTTDTAAVIRACELGCDILLKATKVDGIYEDDPLKNPHARFIETITHEEFLKKNIRIMDATAISIARDEKLPIDVVNIYKDNMVVRACQNEIIKSSILSS